MSEITVQAKNIHKQFRPPHQPSSVKSIFTSIFKNKKKHTKSHIVIDGVSLEIKKGEFFGIVGRNGSGKSTMLKILAGIYQPTKGTLRVSGRLVPFIELGVGFNPELTGKDNVYLNGAILGFSKSEIDVMYDSIVEFAELSEFMDEKLKNYSSGMQVRLAFSMAIRANADILLIDEVLAVGDASFQKKCYDYFFELKQNGKTVIFVSHDMSAVKTYCDRAILIESGKVIYSGTASTVAEKYKELFLPKEAGAKVIRRWGSGEFKQDSVSVEVGHSNITIDVRGRATGNVDNLLCGLHILSEDGKELTAFNNDMLNVKGVGALSPGDVVNLSWTVANIFSTGRYFVNLTYVDIDDKVLDWILEAITFTVLKKQKSVTNIMPEAKFVFNYEGAKVDD